MIFRTIFSIFWITTLLVFYLMTHDQLIISVFSGRHLALLLSTILIFSGVIYQIKKGNWKGWATGSAVWVAVFTMMLFIQLTMIIHLNIISEVNFSRWLGFNFLAWGIMPLFLLSSLMLGSLLNYGQTGWIQLGLGIMLHTLFLFLLTQLNAFHAFSVGAIFFIPLVIKPMNSYYVFKKLMISPIILKEPLSLLGWGSIIITLFLFSANLVESIRPFPKGYDALTLYYNLTSTIHQSGQLTEGIGAFYWILYSGFGLFMTQSDQVSFAFFPFVIFVSGLLFFDISKRYLDLNHALMALALLLSIPLINSIGGLQQKVEGGILFFSLLILFVLVKDFGKWNRGTYFLLGLFMGFLFGIKFSAFIFIMGILLILAGADWNKYAVFPGLAIFLLVIIKLNLDSFSGMNLYHAPTTLFLYLLITISSVGAILIFMMDRPKSFLFFKKIMFLAIGFLLTISPMLINNYLETGKFDRESLLNGKRSNLYINIQK
jgi:hypothetical protein